MEGYKSDSSNDRQQVDLGNVFPARTARTRWRMP